MKVSQKGIDNINPQVNIDGVVLRKVRSGASCILLAMGTDRTCQLFDFLAQLVKEDPGEAARVAALLDRTAEHGPPKDETKCRFFKSLRIFELKTRGGVRIMAFWEESRLIICSHAFMKKSQKTPDSEKKRAADAKADYVKAKAHNLIRRVD